jgi:DNA repair exonuclease SbcCD ATPase subunit
MTKFGKALVVFIAVMSVAFLAFVGVTALGGPNWQQKAAALDGYAIDPVPGDTPQWKVTERVTGKELGTKPNLPAAILVAQDARKQAQQAQLSGLVEQITRTQQTIDAEKPASATDAAGIQARFAALETTMEQLDAQIKDLIRQGTQQAQQAEAIRTEAEARRSDVARLQAELAQVGTDRFRIDEQIKQLEQRLIRLGGQIDRAARRHEQLVDRNKDYDPAAEN